MYVAGSSEGILKIQKVRHRDVSERSNPPGASPETRQISYRYVIAMRSKFKAVLYNVIFLDIL